MASKAHPVGGNESQPVFDAAVVVLVDRKRNSEPSIFLGKRQASNVFLPGKWVFPGGRTEPDDLQVSATDTLAEGDIAALVWGMNPPWIAHQANAMALTAVREVFEETGLVIGGHGRMTGAIPPAWSAYHATGHQPRLAPLQLLARAITPPGRPRRYDTRFFLSPAEAVVSNAGTHDGEFSEQGWFTMSECRAMDLPNITRLVLDDASETLQRARQPTCGAIPFYYQDGGTFRRDLIPR